jgi:hypothetical protein
MEVSGMSITSFTLCNLVLGDKLSNRVGKEGAFEGAFLRKEDPLKAIGFIVSECAVVLAVSLLIEC